MPLVRDLSGAPKVLRGCDEDVLDTSHRLGPGKLHSVGTELNVRTVGVAEESPARNKWNGHLLSQRRRPEMGRIVS